jgi:hypothetical protein
MRLLSAGHHILIVFPIEKSAGKSGETVETVETALRVLNL